MKTLTKAWLAVILAASLLSLTSCQARQEVTVKYSDAIYVVQDARVVDQSGVEQALEKLDGWYVITPGLLRKLYREKVEEVTPED